MNNIDNYDFKNFKLSDFRKKPLKVAKQTRILSLISAIASLTFAIAIYFICYDSLADKLQFFVIIFAILGAFCGMCSSFLTGHMFSDVTRSEQALIKVTGNAIVWGMCFFMIFGKSYTPILNFIFPFVISLVLRGRTTSVLCRCYSKKQVSEIDS